jgi:hypothetical protein
MKTNIKTYRISWVETVKKIRPEQISCSELITCDDFDRILSRIRELIKSPAISITLVEVMTPKAITLTQQRLLDEAIYNQHWEI